MLEEKGYYDLTDLERKWRDRQPALEALSYMLRPRFRPGWIPSWKDNNLVPGFCEDGLKHRVSQFKYIADGFTIIARIKDNASH